MSSTSFESSAKRALFSSGRSPCKPSETSTGTAGGRAIFGLLPQPLGASSQPTESKLSQNSASLLQSECAGFAASSQSLFASQPSLSPRTEACSETSTVPVGFVCNNMPNTPCELEERRASDASISPAETVADCFDALTRSVDRSVAKTSKSSAISASTLLKSASAFSSADKIRSRSYRSSSHQERSGSPMSSLRFAARNPHFTRLLQKIVQDW